MTDATAPRETQLVIERLPDGGFLVRGEYSHMRQGCITPFLFAATTVEEALRYVKKKLTA
jgi:hypothetical protein